MRRRNEWRKKHKKGKGETPRFRTLGGDTSNPELNETPNRCTTRGIRLIFRGSATRRPINADDTTHHVVSAAHKPEKSVS